ncbi:MAG: hypothetical protein JO165_03380 [Candidatus Eremiobacteraeota bacterium]|nr:hypothetical protein [Candidatus Eremiobacteraeota bacterium]
MISRREMLRLTGGVLLLSGCRSHRARVLRVGSQSSAESALIAEIYAVALERAKIPVQRHMNLGDAAAIDAAIGRGDIDLFPEYMRSEANTPAGHAVLRLQPSPLDSAPCVVTTESVAEQYWLLDLSTCSRIARTLKFAATEEFLAASGPLRRLQRVYGGFKFGSVVTVDAADRYDALKRGDVEVASGFTTDAQIHEGQLVVLRDDKRALPRYTYAPAIRHAAAVAYPAAVTVLNRVSRSITTFAVQQINAHVDLLHIDPSDAAEEFLNRTTS